MRNATASTVQLGNWYAVAAVAAAGLGLAGGAPEAEAGQVVVLPAGGPVTAPLGPTGHGSNSSGAVYFNLLDRTGTQVGTIVPPAVPPASADFAITWGRSSSRGGATIRGIPSTARVLASSSSYARKLQAHAPISSSGSFARFATLGSNSSGRFYGAWRPGDKAFVGLAVQTAGFALTFGWAEIQLGSGHRNAFDPTLIAWGFNDQPFGTAFAGGTPAPEPSSLLLLASGVAGLAAYRRRRAQRRAAAAVAAQ